jgi:hypothetical protein
MSVDDLGSGRAASLPGLRLSMAPSAGAHPASVPARPRLMREFAARMRGPGGYYNFGNAMGLAGGVSLAAWNAASSGTGGAATAAATYFAGNASAVALTVATLIFFWSGEVYHRAWTDPQKPDIHLNRQGDLLSAIGAVALGLSLALFGLPLLAATAGLLHALGKLGSALHPPGTPALPGWPESWPDLFRSVVLFSRVPATLVAALALGADLTGADSRNVIPALLGPGVLLICNLLWAKADLLLFRSAD